MQRITKRPWIQRTVLVFITAMFLLIGISLLIGGDVIGKRDWGSIIIAGFLILASVPGIWLAARLGVVVDYRGIRFHNFGRGRFVPWSEVTEVLCVNYDRRGLPLYAPAVQIMGEQDPLVLSALGSYRQEAAERHTEAIRSLLIASRTASPNAAAIRNR